MGATYGYRQLADRIEEVLGTRPSPSSLRAAAAAARRTGGTQSPPRLTAGMPAPLPRTSATDPAAFPADQVEQWLAHHPRLAWRAAVQRAADALHGGADPADVVAAARAAGLSWRTITALLAEQGAAPRSTAGVHKRYRRPAP